MPKTYRVAIIGATGQGDYGHGLDTAFQNVPGSQIVAIADPQPEGLRRAGEKLQLDKRYTDYRTMLKQEKPDIVCIGPRWLTDRVAMFEACAELGCHIYCEKPLAQDLEDVDAIVKVCRQAKLKVALAHQWRAMPPVQEALRRLAAQQYGKLIAMRTRPKDDQRGGGEELLVHGTHMFDLMIAIAGRPRWASAHIMNAGREAQREDLKKPSEPIGPITGDSIAASYGFEHGIRGFFDSTAGLHRGKESPFGVLFGLYLECEKACLHFRQPGDVYIYPAPTILADEPKLTWEKLWIEDWHFTPEHKPQPRPDWLHYGNQYLAKNLLEAIEKDRAPLSSVEEVRFVLEMVQGTYASHFAEGQRIAIPLRDRRHPLRGRA